MVRLEDFERFLRSRPSRKGLSGESSSVAEAEVDVVSVPVPLMRTEGSEGVYTRERRAALSGSADCERGIRVGCSAATGVDGGGSTAWSAGGEAVSLAAKGEGGEGGVVGCATEPLSETSISITDLAEAEADEAVSSSIGEGTPSESSSEGDGPASCVKLSSRDSRFASCNTLELCIVTLTVLGDDMWAATSERTRRIARSTRTLSRSSVRTRTKRFH